MVLEQVKTFLVTFSKRHAIRTIWEKHYARRKRCSMKNVRGIDHSRSRKHIGKRRHAPSFMLFLMELCYPEDG